MRIHVPSAFGGRLDVEAQGAVVVLLSEAAPVEGPAGRCRVAVSPGSPRTFQVVVQTDGDFTLRARFFEMGAADPDRRPWSIASFWPVADRDGTVRLNNLYDTAAESPTGEDQPLVKLDRALGLAGAASAVTWEKGVSAMASDIQGRPMFYGHYLPQQFPREWDAERDWYRDLDGNGRIEAGVAVDLTGDRGTVLHQGDGDTEDRYDASWWGHCNGWAAAAVLFEAPTEAVTVAAPDGSPVTFSVEDQKALLVELGTSDLEEDCVTRQVDAYERWLETRHPLLDDEPGEAGRPMGTVPLPDGVWAARVHRFLGRWLRDAREPVYGDLKSSARWSTEQRWSYPIIAYAAELTERGGNERNVDVRLALGAVYYDGGERVDTDWRYHLAFDARGRIVERRSGWDTTLRNGKPLYLTYLCRPTAIAGRGLRNPAVTLERVVAILGRDPRR